MTPAAAMSAPTAHVRPATAHMAGWRAHVTTGGRSGMFANLAMTAADTGMAMAAVAEAAVSAAAMAGPAVPSARSAPPIAAAPSVAAIIIARPMPAIDIPAIVLAAEKELDLFQVHRLVQPVAAEQQLRRGFGLGGAETGGARQQGQRGGRPDKEISHGWVFQPGSDRRSRVSSLKVTLTGACPTSGPVNGSYGGVRARRRWNSSRLLQEWGAMTSLRLGVPYRRALGAEARVQRLRLDFGALNRKTAHNRKGKALS